MTTNQPVDLNLAKKIVACLPFADNDRGLPETEQMMRLMIGEIESLRAQNKNYADRHWTCNGCGFSWNCDDAGVDERGCKICPIKCPACALKKAEAERDVLRWRELPPPPKAKKRSKK